MKINKRLLSFFLAVLMVVSTFGDSVYAISENVKANSANKKTEIEGKVEGNKEVFTFDLSKLTEKAEPITTKAMPARAPRRAPVQNDTTVNIKAEGLNGGAFDWDALPNKEFKLIAKWKTKDGQEHEKPFATITAEGTSTHNVGWPVDGTMTGNASIETDYNQNVEVRVVDVYSSSTGGAGKLVFDITLKELAEPRADVKYVDPYGRELTDPADLPTGTMPKVTAPELTDVEIDLPNSSKQINMRSSDDIDEDDLNAAENGLTFKVEDKTTGETVTIDGKDYKLDISAPNPKEIGTIKMVYQKDVLVPPADGDGNPVAPADGYVRLTFDANEKVEAGKTGITGTHNNGLYAGKQFSYIDVKQGVNYDNTNLQAAIKELVTTGTKEVDGETKTFAQKAKAPWTPAVPTDATLVTKATYNAQYEKSAAEQVTELGGLKPVTIKVWKGDTVHWENGVAPKTTNTDDAALVQQLLDNAEVTDLSSRSSDAAGKFEGRLQVKFGDGSTLEVANQWLYVWEHIVKVDPNNTDPDAPKEEDLPSDKIEVRFLASTGVESITTTGKTYAKEGTVFQDTDFPQEKDITFKEGYKRSVTWTPKDKKVTRSSRAFDKRQGYFRFTATATQETTADKVKALGGLKGVDFAEFVGATLDWKKGVAPADGVKDADKATIEKAIQEATVEDTTAQKRTTDAKGTFPGTLKVTFKDGSVYVANEQGATEAEKTNIEQKLYVYDKKDVVPTDPTQPTPEDAVVVTYNKGDGVKELQGTGKTLVKSGETLTEDDFPTATLEEGHKDLTWSGQTAGNPKDYTVTENNKVFTATAVKKTTAEEVTELGGLSPETIKVWVKDEIDWSKGVKATTEANKDKVAALLKDATVTDKTDPARTSDAAGKYEGTLLVTFKDKSSLEVPKQMLIVSDNKVVDPQNPEDLPDNKIKVEFTKGTGVTDIAAKDLYVKPGTELVEADFPQATVDTANGYKEPAAWTPEDKVVTEDNKTFTATATKDTNFDKTNIVEITFVKDPDKMSYTEGEPLNQDGLKIKLKDKNGNEVTIGKDKLNEYGVTVTPNDGTNLTIDEHNGKSLIASVNDKDGKTITDNSPGTLTVTKKVEGKPSVTYPTTDMDKGETKTVIPEIKDKKGEPTRPDTTPEVVQPGNGVVVTPHPDGSITVTIPEDYDGPSTIVIPVEVTVDREKIHTTLTIRVRDNKPGIDYYIPELRIHEYVETHPVYASVDKKVVDKEVINSHDQYIFGYPDDTIRPDGDMTRAEAIAVVARLQKLDLSDKSSKIYKDTKADMWYNGAINAAFREGYLLEKEGENVRPNDKITRAELAELISHIDKKNNAIAPFDDVKGHKFEAAINQAYGNGRIEGYPDGTFKPDNFITRAEVATMLNKLYDRYPDKNFIDANQNLVHNYKDMSYKGHWGYYELVEAYHSHTYLRLKDNMEEWKVIIK